MKKKNKARLLKKQIEEQENLKNLEQREELFHRKEIYKEDRMNIKNVDKSNTTNKTNKLLF